MAKAPVKASTEKAPAKKVASKAKTTISIEKVSTDVLAKLKALNLDTQLQADIEWCLGSYRNDQNPIGLIDMAHKAIAVFKEEQAKKTKGVTAKLISDLEKAVKG